MYYLSEAQILGNKLRNNFVRLFLATHTPTSLSTTSPRAAGSPLTFTTRMHLLNPTVPRT